MRYILMVLIAAVACGPSNQEIRRAKTASYNAPSEQLFDIALQVTQQDYKVAEVDAAGRRFSTAPQFYNPEGGRQSPGADGYVQYMDRSIILSLVVEIVQVEGGRTAVHVRPNTFQMISGSPKPRELLPDDPNLPPWVLGRVDNLAVAIYERSKNLAAP